MPPDNSQPRVEGLTCNHRPILAADLEIEPGIRRAGQHLVGGPTHHLTRHRVDRRLTHGYSDPGLRNRPDARPRQESQLAPIVDPDEHEDDGAIGTIRIVTCVLDHRCARRPIGETLHFANRDRQVIPRVRQTDRNFSNRLLAQDQQQGRFESRGCARTGGAPSAQAIVGQNSQVQGDATHRDHTPAK